jgi:hypothetical protein
MSSFSSTLSKNIISNIDGTDSLSDKIMEYIRLNHPKLYILTPCYGGMCHLNYVCSLMQTIDIFKKYDFPLEVEFCKNDSLVSRARNNLVAKAMHDPEMTHILFIDSDITWDPIDVFKLVFANKPIIGGVYPIKNYFWNKLIPTKTESKPNSESESEKNRLDILLEKRNQSSVLKRLYSEEDYVKQNILNYNINYIGSKLNIDNNIAEVKHIATGFMMIQRSTFVTMMENYSDTKYIDDVSFLSGNENDFAYALFDCRVEDNRYLSEDWLFCNRWSKLGGKIYIDVSIDLTHTGQEDYKGSYISSIM